MSISPQTRDFMVRGVLYLLAMCIPIAVSLAWNKPDITLLGGMGALFALFIAPRYTPLPRVLCIGAGGLLVCLAATVGFFTQGNNNLALIPLVLFSWLAALPRPDQAYLSLVVKNMAAAALLTHFGLTGSLSAAGFYMSGIALGATLSVLGIPFGSGQGHGASPFEEFKAFTSGAVNDRLFGVAVPLTVLLCTLAARQMNFSHPAWVGLTVLFVMHSDGATELHRIRDRALGTVLGVIAAAPVVFNLQAPLQLAGCIALAALFIPYAQAGRYMLFSLIITFIVLLLVDMAMLGTGGDISLLGWRLIDTILACGGVLVANLTLRLIALAKQQTTSTQN